MTTLFTQRHYVALALMLKNESDREQAATTARSLADYFEKLSPKFKRDLFLRSCGVSTFKIGDRVLVLRDKDEHMVMQHIPAGEIGTLVTLDTGHALVGHSVEGVAVIGIKLDNAAKYSDLDEFDGVLEFYPDNGEKIADYVAPLDPNYVSPAQPRIRIVSDRSL